LGGYISFEGGEKQRMEKGPFSSNGSFHFIKKPVPHKTFFCQQNFFFRLFISLSYHTKFILLHDYLWVCKGGKVGVKLTQQMLTFLILYLSIFWTIEETIFMN